MSFTPESKVLVQGITEPLGSLYTPLMKAYGTQVVAAVSPGHGGQERQGIPIFDLVEQVLPAVGDVDTTVIFVSPYTALDAALEAIAAGIRQIVLVTAGIPPLDMVQLIRKAEATETLIVGPNSPGIIVPGQVLLGTHPSECYTPGPVGLISRSGTLTYEVALELTRAGFGQAISVGIGSDSIVGSTFPQWLQILDEDEQTEVIVLIGEIGGDNEEVAARYIAETIDKPVVAYVAGRNAPLNKHLGHASEIRIWHHEAATTVRSREKRLDIGTAQSKIDAFQLANIPVAECPSQIPSLVQAALQKH